MKISRRQLRKIIKEAITAEGGYLGTARWDPGRSRAGYNSMSDAGKALAKRAKRQFAKDYPEIKVSIDSRQGWITVNGKKAVNMSSASGQGLSLEDVIDRMKQAYLDPHPDPYRMIEAGEPDLPRADDESWTIGRPGGSTDHLFPDDWGMPKYKVNDSSQDSPAQEPGTYSGTLVMGPHGDAILVDGVETYIQDVPGELERITGEEMQDSDVDALLDELEKQFSTGYVELPIEMKHGVWSW